MSLYVVETGTAGSFSRYLSGLCLLKSDAGQGNNDTTIECSSDVVEARRNEELERVEELETEKKKEKDKEKKKQVGQ